MEQRARLELRAALAALTAPGRTGTEVAAALDRVEAARAALGDGVPAQLRHFLDRRSYAKALAWLQGERDA